MPECPTTFFFLEGRIPKCPVGDVRLESGSARRPECPTTFLFPGRYGDGRLKRESAHHCPNTRVPDPFLPRRNDIKLLHTSEKFISKKTKCPSARGARVPEASIPSLSSAISNYVGKIPKLGVGVLTQTHFLMSIYQVIFGMPKWLPTNLACHLS